MRKKKQEKLYPEEKVLAINYVEINQHKGKLFKVTSNKCGKCGHRASDFQGNKNKLKGNNNKGSPRFDGEFNNCGKGATGRLGVGQRRKMKNMTSTNSLWVPHYMDNSHKVTTNNTPKNVWETEVCHRISHTQRKLLPMLNNARLM